MSPIEYDPQLLTIEDCVDNYTAQKEKKLASLAVVLVAAHTDVRHIDRLISDIKTTTPDFTTLGSAITFAKRISEHPNVVNCFVRRTSNARIYTIFSLTDVNVLGRCGTHAIGAAKRKPPWWRVSAAPTTFNIHMFEDRTCTKRYPIRFVAHDGSVCWGTRLDHAGAYYNIQSQLARIIANNDIPAFIATLQDFWLQDTDTKEHARYETPSPTLRSTVSTKWHIDTRRTEIAEAKAKREAAAADEAREAVIVQEEVAQADNEADDIIDDELADANAEGRDVF